MTICYFFPVATLSPLPRNQRPQEQCFQERRENKLIYCPGLQTISCTWRKEVMFSQQLLTGSLFLNCQNVQYLPRIQSNKIAFSTLMGKSPRQKSLWTEYRLFFFCRKNQCCSSMPLIQEQPITAHWLALTLLMQNVLVCLPCLNGSSCTTLLPPSDLQISPWGPACTDDLLPSVGTLLHGACSSALAALAVFKPSLDTRVKVPGTPVSSRPGKPTKLQSFRGV